MVVVMKSQYQRGVNFWSCMISWQPRQCLMCLVHGLRGHDAMAVVRKVVLNMVVVRRVMVRVEGMFGMGACCAG